MAQEPKFIVSFQVLIRLKRRFTTLGGTLAPGKEVLCDVDSAALLINAGDAELVDVKITKVVPDGSG